MDIATLGVRIDPAEALKGAAAIVGAADGMQKAVDASIAAVETSAEGLGDAFKGASEEINQATDKTVAAVEEMAVKVDNAEEKVVVSHTESAEAAQKAAQAETLAAAKRAQEIFRLQTVQQRSGAIMVEVLARENAARQAAAAAASAASSAVMSAVSLVNNAQSNVSRSNVWERVRANALATANSIRFNVVSAFDLVRTSAQNMAASASNSFQRMTNAARSSFSSIRSQASGLLSAMGLMNGPLGDIANRLERFNRITSRIPAMMTPVLGVLAAAVVAFLGLAGAITTTFEAMSRAGPVQASQMGLEAITGSAEQADAVLSALRENAKRTGADLTASLDTSRKFIGLGFSPADAVKLDKSIQDIAGTLGLSSARATELGNALAQVQSKGVVSMEELRQQIAEKGIPVFNELANKLGVTQGKLIEMVEKGEVESKKLIDIFLNLEGGFAKFAGGAERGTSKLPGAISRLKANWNDLLVTMGAPINDAITPILNSVSDALGSATGRAQGIGDAIAQGIERNKGTITASLDSIGQAIQAVFSMMSSKNGFWEMAAVNFWSVFAQWAAKAMQYIFASLKTAGEVITMSMQDGVEALSVVLDPNFWEPIKVALYNASVDFSNSILKGAEAMVNFLTANLPDWLGGGTKVNFGEGFSRIENTAPAAKPMEIFEMNNRPGGYSGLFQENLKETQEALAHVNEYWKDFAESYNRTNLVPLSQKLEGKTELSTVGGASSSGGVGVTTEAMKKAAAEADRLAKQMEASAQRYIKATQTPMEKYQETVAEVNKLTEAGLLTAEQRTRALAAASEELSERSTAAFEKMASPMQKLMNDWSNLADKAAEATASITGGIADSISGALADFATGTKTAEQAFSDMARAIVGDIIQIISRMLIMKAISAAFGGVGGGVTAGVMHTGGTVGSPGATRNVSGSAWKGAPKFQHGGTIGSGERAIVAEPGETMLTRPQSSDIKKRLQENKDQPEGRKIELSIANVIDPKLIEQIVADSKVVLNVISANAGRVKKIIEQRA